jgi:GTP cyclohydrolase III
VFPAVVPEFNDVISPVDKIVNVDCAADAGVAPNAASAVAASAAEAATENARKSDLDFI